MGRLTIASIKMLYRDKQALFYALLFPVIFAVVFGLFDVGSGPDVRIALVAAQQTDVSRSLVDGFKKVDGFKVVTRSDEARAIRELKDGDRDAVVVVPGPQPRPGCPPFARGGRYTPGTICNPTTVVRLLYNGAQLDRNGAALGAINQVIGSVNGRLLGVQPAVRVEAQSVAAKTVRFYDFLLPGLVAMGVMNFSIFGMSVQISRFREQRILKRILATPLRPAKFLAGQVFARLLLAMVQALVILAVGVFIFHAHVYGNVVWIMLLSAVANLIFLNIGFAIAGRSPNPDAAQGVANAVAMPMMFLSGVFFPIDTLPKVLETAVKYLPLTPLITALRKVANDGAAITSTGWELLQLAAWIVVSFLLASRMFRFGETR
jgi:ABC-2 type transport system permease protein